MKVLGRRDLTILVSVLAILALALPLAPAANAQLSGFSIDCDDQSGDDAESNPAGESETYTCLVRDTNGDPVNNAEVDAENLNGANDPDNSAAAGTADFSPACTTGVNGVCTFSLVPSANEGGSANVCFWVDNDDDNVFAPTGAENDGGGCPDEPPATEDTDGIDVVTKTWAGPSVAPTVLDCDDESGDDAQTNAFGQSETYTCLVTGAGGADVSGAKIDWENLAGANDPDNSAAAGTADGNDACTTGNAGTCTIVISPTDNQIGTANVCFWVDTDSDTAFDTAGSAADGGGCAAESAATEDSDLIDVVSKTWTGTTPDGLDCDDQSGDDAETNNLGQAETYTCTATAPDSGDNGTERDPAEGISIDWENLDGANDPDNSSNNSTPDGNDACTTTANGTCTISIAPAENQAGAATICFWADTDADNVFDQNGAANDGGGCNAEPASTEDIDLIDTVTKTWAQVADVVDCDDQSGDDAQTNNANEPETYTCSVTAPDGSDNGSERDPISGMRIDWENLNGVNDADNSSAAGTPDGNDTCTTGTGGTCTITISPSEGQTGSATICFWADNDADNVYDPAGAANDGGTCLTEAPATEDSNLVDTVTKTWSSSLARFIDCDPETSSREVGSTQTITCVVTNISGARVANQSVTFQESGAGELISAAVVTTDANGVATATVRSTGEIGDQSLTGVITDDLAGAEPGDVDECDRAANDPSGAAAGDCSDTVTVSWAQIPCLGRPGEILGTSGDDVLTGTEGDDVICAGAGDDIVDGLGGSDLMFLGSGSDRASGGSGNDDIVAGSGRDSVEGDGGDDVLRGRGHPDTLLGGGGRDIVLGGGGEDLIRGGAASDDLRGSKGNDSLYGDGGNDLLNGGGGTDRCSGGPGRDDLRNCERR